MSNSEYTPPETSNTGKAAEKADQALEQAAKSTAKTSESSASKDTETKTQDTAKEPTLAETPAVISVSKMLNAKGNVVSDIMQQRIENHVKYLRGEASFESVEQAAQEQVNFIETVGNMLKLDFEQYVVITDYFLNVIRENPQVFSDGMAFRFAAGLSKDYPSEYIKNYQAYIEMLTKIAQNWKVRFKLGKLMDISSVIAPMPRKGKENVTQYFRKVASA
jgi:hypothetical protein